MRVVEVVERTRVGEHFTAAIVDHDRCRIADVAAGQPRYDVVELAFDEALQTAIEGRSHARASRCNLWSEKK